MAATLVALLAFGAALIASNRRLGRAAFLIGALPLLAGTGYLASELSATTHGSPRSITVSWVPALHLDLVFRLDGLALAMGLLICGIGALVLAFCWSYFSDAETDAARLAGLIVLFGGAMLGVVAADSVFTLFVFWELTSILSYLLIGLRTESAAARASATQALLTTGCGGIVLLGGLVLISQAGGTPMLSVLGSSPPTGVLASVGLALALVGAATKSAQFPFSYWLPGAMVAPTPISAYLHSATMVKAGVVLIARLAPIGDATGWWRPAVIALGGISMLVSGARAMRQTDLKLLLAHGTVSQLGLMVMLVGSGWVGVSGAGLALLVAHALFKSALFLMVGVVDHQAHTRDIRKLDLRDPSWRLARWLMIISALSMAGIPPLLGFVAKEKVLATLESSGERGATALLVLVAAGSVLTVGYSARFIWAVLGGAATDPRQIVAAPAPSLTFVAPAAVPVAATIVAAFVPGPLSHLIGAAAGQLYDTAAEIELHLWEGLTPAVGWSAAIVAVGLAAFVLAGRRIGNVGPLVLPDGPRVFTQVIHGGNVLAARVTGVVQNGSLPVYIGVILLTITGTTLGVGIASAGDRAHLPALVDPPLEVVIVAVVTGSALAAVLTSRRFAAALCLGGMGYGLIGAFILAGAPDLALTQAAIETLSTVLFVLVFRVLPDRFPRARRTEIRPLAILRFVVPIVVGVFVFIVTLVAYGDRTAAPISDGFNGLSLSEAGGRNVVNVILVDFRGFDTMGEITVLTVAAIGALSLTFLRHEDAPIRRPFRTAPRRSVLLDTIATIAFPSLLVFSLYLLFAGHNQPGGGFVGGLVAGAAFGLRYAAGGLSELRSTSRVSPWVLLGAGLMVSSATAAAPLLAGYSVLESTKLKTHLPVIGTVQLSTASVFDFGVYLVVVGLVLMVLEAFGIPSATRPDRTQPAPLRRRLSAYSPPSWRRGEREGRRAT